MKEKPTQKVTVTLPHTVYHALRNEAYRQGISLPEFIQKKVQLRPSEPTSLAKLPLKEIIQRTTPDSLGPDARLDFFS